jgi:erythrin-vacuolar iron transport family protein
MAKHFSELTDREILALAISLEEEDSRIYAEMADRFRGSYPATAAAISAMEAEETVHRQRLIDRFRARFGDTIPLIHKQDVNGFTQRKALWLMKTFTVAQARREIGLMEFESRRFYEAAQARTTDAETRKLLGDLAHAEVEHSAVAERLESEQVETGIRASEEETARRMFVLQIVQPALAGLMDGSVSTLAPLFAAAFATKSSHDALLVGLASSVGAGISMGFAEALSDDGALSGRGHPLLRGTVCGLMTTIGGIGHTLPFLASDFHLAFSLAVGVVAIELFLISWIRHHYMDTPFLSAAFQVIVGGVLVFAAGLIIGSS